MSRKTKVRIFKIILTILVLALILGIIIYLFPVMKNLSTMEGKIAFEQRIDNSKLLRSSIIIWTPNSTNISYYNTR